MEMNEFSIKDKPNVSSNNIYNETNVGKFFISIDLKKANFQTLKNIDSQLPPPKGRGFAIKPLGFWRLGDWPHPAT